MPSGPARASERSLSARRGAFPRAKEGGKGYDYRGTRTTRQRLFFHAHSFSPLTSSDALRNMTLLNCPEIRRVASVPQGQAASGLYAAVSAAAPSFHTEPRLTSHGCPEGVTSWMPRGRYVMHAPRALRHGCPEGVTSCMHRGRYVMHAPRAILHG